MSAGCESAVLANGELAMTSPRHATRTLLAAALLAGLGAAPCAAGAEDIANELFDASFAHMASTYMCREALGGLSYFQAAIAIAEGNLQATGMSPDDAVLMVNELKVRFEEDPRARKPDLDTASCLDVVADSLQAAKVARAKWNRLAAE